MCYTEKQLGNKIKNLANKNKKYNKQKGKSMSGNKNKINERSGEENKVLDETTLTIPREVIEGKAVEANWRDDNEEMAKEIDEEIGYETFENEASYESPADEQIADLEKFRDQERLSEIIRRAKAQKIGKRILALSGVGRTTRKVA